MVNRYSDGPNENEAKMESIAIIGMSCRFPGAPNPRAFWQLLCNGSNAITEVPTDRYDIDAVYDPRPGTPGKVTSRWGGFLDQIDQFDTAFFGLSPREASRIDPQHRLLLEVAWEAMEDAGLVPEQLKDIIAGVFIGIITNDYWDRQFHNPIDLDVYSTAGSARSGAAGRISYALGLQGVSVALDAACSSSLVAVHLACQSLRTGSCAIALAGGVNVILNPDHTIGFSQGNMMAPDGRCKTFDVRADGYVRSEGAGVVVLKPLSHALADGDTIYAVIRGSASNNDGHSESFMAPSVKGQQAVLRQACRDAAINPLHVDYVEAHGTGTSVGDPVEIKALGSILCAERSAQHPLIVGSVKTNIGHTEGAAGLAGLIKVALCLKHKMIPPNLHFHEPNPVIPWQDYALMIPTRLMPWPESDGPRLAGVSSFGIAGTNAHIILEEAPQLHEQNPKPENGIRPTAYLLPLSAQTFNGLKELARNYLAHLEDEEYADQALSDICYMASLHRTHHDYRLAIISHNKEECHNKLKDFLHDKTSMEVSREHRISNQPQKIVWIFPGQGSQWLGMGRDLLEQEPVFRTAIEECDQIMSHFVAWSLLDQLQADKEHSCQNEIDVIQPILFAIEVALATLWRSWGIEPDAVVGHSMGEVAAAYVAGALSLEDAAWIVCARSKLLLRMSGKGAMAVVELSLEQAESIVSGYKDLVSVAVNNSPTSTVLSGDPDALAEILATLERNGVFSSLVKVDVASHCPQMDLLHHDLLQLMQRVQPHQGNIPMYSSVTGELVEGSTLKAPYWVNNLRHPVLFLTATQKLLEDNFDIFIEMSPHPILVSAIRETIESYGKSGLVLASLRRDEDGRAALLAAFGNLYTQGCKLNWAGLYPFGGHRVPSPNYPWQRQRCWNSNTDYSQSQAFLSSWTQSNDATALHPILGRRNTPLALQPETFFWTIDITQEIFPYLSEHCVHDMPVLPCAAYIELSLAAGAVAFGLRHFHIHHLELKKALFFPKGITQTLQVILTPYEVEGKMMLSFFSTQMGQGGQAISWTQHAHAIVSREEGPITRDPLIYSSPEQALNGWILVMETKKHYESLRTRGIQHGPLFQGVTHVWRRPGEVICDITIPRGVASDMRNYHVHPALMDVVLQGITPFLPEENEQQTYIPVAVKQVKFYRQPTLGDKLRTHAIVRSEKSGDQNTLEGDIILFDEQGQVLLEILGLLLQSLDNNSQDYMRQRMNQLLYTLNWEQQTYNEQRKKGIQHKRWLIFSEHNGLGQLLAERLQADGENYVIVTPGQSYNQLETRHYELSPLAPEEFYRLLKEISCKDDEHAIGIVYLWGMLLPSLNEKSVAIDLASVGVMHLIQAITAVKKEAYSRLWLVTGGVHTVEEQDRTTTLAQALLWGLGRVIVYEHQNLHCTLIDLDSAPSEEQSRALFKEIYSDDEADEVALRGERRYVARLAHYSLPDEQEQADTLFRPDGTYLITGGLGGVGLRTAQWMAEQGAQHLVLMGRHNVAMETETTLQAIRETGVTVSVMLVDVTQEVQLTNALAQVRDQMPPLRGIFHAAVVLDDSILLQQNRERFLRVLQPKVDGAWNLHRLTLDDPLDYFVLFSSAASLIGSPGQSNYAAANAFLDMLAYYRRQLGYPALSINWGRWGEVGQAMKENRGELLDLRGFNSMKPKESLAILGSLLRQNLPQVGVMSFHLGKWSQFYPKLTRSSLFVRLLEEAGTDSEDAAWGQFLTREMLTELDDEQRQQILAQYLSKQIARVLGHTSSKLEPHQQLNRLGLDSLMSVELKNRIESDLDVVIPVTAFLQGITFEQLTQQINHFLREHCTDLSSYFNHELKSKATIV